LLRVVELRAVERQERLASRDLLPGLAHVKLGDPSVDLQVDVCEGRLVVGHMTDDAEVLAHRGQDDGIGADADELSAGVVDDDHTLLLLLPGDRDEIHAADGALSRGRLLDGRMHRARVVVDLARHGRRFAAVPARRRGDCRRGAPRGTSREPRDERSMEDEREQGERGHECDRDETPSCGGIVAVGSAHRASSFPSRPGMRPSARSSSPRRRS
jgi:hypothetical protein